MTTQRNRSRNRNAHAMTIRATIIIINARDLITQSNCRQMGKFVVFPTMRAGRIRRNLITTYGEKRRLENFLTSFSTRKTFRAFNFSQLAGPVIIRPFYPVNSSTLSSYFEFHCPIPRHWYRLSRLPCLSRRPSFLRRCGLVLICILIYIFFSIISRFIRHNKFRTSFAS